jgi:hypothetical protein
MDKSQFDERILKGLGPLQYLITIYTIISRHFYIPIVHWILASKDLQKGLENELMTKMRLKVEQSSLDDREDKMISQVMESA